MDAKRINKDLERRYLEILTRHDATAMYKDSEGLSGLFLPAATPEYLSSPRKIMLVGKETRSWRNGDKKNAKPNKVCSIKHGRLNATGVEESMANHSSFLRKAPGNHVFMKLYRRLCGVHTKEFAPTVIWSNLFCTSHNAGPPTRHPHFSKIEKLSKELINAQLEVLKPDCIFFATGPSYDKYIKDFFGGDLKTQKIFEARRLWHFRINDIDCFRTTHPRYGAGEKTRKIAIQTISDWPSPMVLPEKS